MTTYLSFATPPRWQDDPNLEAAPLTSQANGVKVTTCDGWIYLSVLNAEVRLSKADAAKLAELLGGAS